MPKIGDIINQIRFLQPLPNPMNHKYQVSNRDLQSVVVIELMQADQVQEKLEASKKKKQVTHELS